MTEYAKAAKYVDLDKIYSECSGPGGLQLAEFIADKMTLSAHMRVLDIGTSSGYQTCFLAREYGAFVVGIDDGRGAVERLWRNARSWGVQDRVLAVRASVPDTGFPDESFDAAYCTTTLEMIRGFSGEAKYRECLSEVYRVLKPGSVFGCGEPMHLDVGIPDDLAPLVTHEAACWADCFVTVERTVESFHTVGFEVLDAGYGADARRWWEDYARYDPGCRQNPDGDPEAIRVDSGRWLSFGYVIARRPL